MSNRPDACELCGRDRKLTFHHLIPKKMHKRKYVANRFSKEERHTRGIYLCSDCHSQVHDTFDHKALALEYNTLEALRSHPDIVRFVDWVKGQSRRVKK